jgi:ribose/xylose/arabinose/galactoside ABC-type transport system permease subunit
VIGAGAIGMTMIIVSGGIDLSVGSVIALVTVVIAMAITAGWPPLLAALAGLGVAAGCGLFTGVIVTRLRLPPFIVTLGMLSMLRGAAKQITDGSTIFPDDFNWLNSLMTLDGPLGLPGGVWLTVALAVVVSLALRYTRFGRHLFAIGSNEQTARLCGVPVERQKVLIYVWGTVFAGVAGLLQYSYLSGGDPTTAVGLELNIIAAVVIGGGSLSGGVGTVMGSLIGALIMSVVANGCTKLGFGNPLQEIVTGAIIIVAVLLDQLRRKTRV